MPGPISISAYQTAAAAAAANSPPTTTPALPHHPVNDPSRTATIQSSLPLPLPPESPPPSPQYVEASDLDDDALIDSDDDLETATLHPAGAPSPQVDPSDGGLHPSLTDLSSLADPSTWTAVGKVTAACLLSLAITAAALLLGFTVLGKSFSLAASSPFARFPLHGAAAPSSRDRQAAPLPPSSELSPAYRSVFPLHPDSFAKSLHSPPAGSCQPLALSYPFPPPPPYFTASLQALGYPVDPLPQCTLLSYNLTLNLLHFVRYVQDPIIQADCSRYDKSRHCRLSGERLVPRYLIWSVDQKEGGGGYADRLKGLVSTLLIALITERALVIDNTRPLPWTDFWLPSVLPWVTLQELEARVQNRTGADEMLQYNYMGWDAAQLNDHNLRKDWEGHPVVRMRHNGNTFPTVFNNVHLRDYAWALGFDRTMTGDLDYYLGCFLQYLQKPTPLLQNSLNAVLGRIGRPLVSSVKPVLAAHQALAFYTSAPPAGPASIPLFCAQIRMGNGAQAKSFTDSEQFLSHDQLPALFQHFEEKVKERVKGDSPYFLFITSDGKDYVEYVPTHFPSPPAILLEMDASPIHIDKTDGVTDVEELRRSYLMTITSFILLGECDMALLSRSGFGTLSQFRMRQLKKLRGQWRKKEGKGGKEGEVRPYEDLYFIENGEGKVVEFHHVRGGDGRERGDDVKLVFTPPPICRTDG